MAIYYSLSEYIAGEQGTAVALGFFDGVHLGHRAVVSACASAELPCVALTFSRPPAASLGGKCPPLLTDNRRKAALLREIGADDVIFADFDALKNDSPEVFVRTVLHNRLRAGRVYCGFNYRFGVRGSGDVAALREYCGRYGIEVTVCEPVYLDGEPVSSTAVRRLIAGGEIERANAMLGARYRIEGNIAGGNRIGSRMGFPTVNLPLREELAIPRYGVYASVITIDGKAYRGATNIGVHPTVGENAAPVCETFLLDFQGGNLYGRNAVCELSRFVRGERKFNSVDELTARIREDCRLIGSMEL